MGSLRSGSYNRALAHAASRLVPRDAVMEVTGIEGIPVFNQDDEGHFPAAVVDFKNRIRRADAVIFFTPEYNYSMPGPLKNAIDCASRPQGDNPFDGKAAAIASASAGRLGGARAQYHLRQTLVYLNMYPVNFPEVFVTLAPGKFDSSMSLTDERIKQQLSSLLVNLVRMVRALGGVMARSDSRTAAPVGQDALSPSSAPSRERARP